MPFIAHGAAAQHTSSTHATRQRHCLTMSKPMAWQMASYTADVHTVPLRWAGRQAGGQVRDCSLEGCMNLRASRPQSACAVPQQMRLQVCNADGSFGAPHFLMQGSIDVPRKLRPPEQKNLCAVCKDGSKRQGWLPHPRSKGQQLLHAQPAACRLAPRRTRGLRLGMWAPSGASQSPTPVGGRARVRLEQQKGGGHPGSPGRMAHQRCCRPAPPPR